MVEAGTGNQKGLTIVESVITLCLIGIMIGVVIPRYQRVAREAQETALMAELVNIRTSIKLFKIINNRNPGSIKEMMEKDMILPGRTGKDGMTGSVFKDKYLMHYEVDEQGEIIDSFGNRFDYDPLRGEVKATTKGYEDW